MRIKFTIVVLLTATVTFAQKPAGLSVYTWTREDFFAAFLRDDMERFDIGMKKIDDILAANPKDPDALAMKAAGLTYLAVKDHETGNSGDFNLRFENATELLEEAVALDPQGIGVNAVGGVMLLFYERLPPERRPSALDRARKSYYSLYSLQESMLDKLPLHHRGEILAGLAEVEKRLGNEEQARTFLERIVRTLPDTPYARRAEQWLAEPESIADENRIICQTCHDPGRLENRLLSIRQ